MHFTPVVSHGRFHTQIVLARDWVGLGHTHTVGRSEHTALTRTLGVMLLLSIPVCRCVDYHFLLLLSSCFICYDQIPTLAI
jgi:hypothetical protein